MPEVYTPEEFRETRGEFKGETSDEWGAKEDNSNDKDPVHNEIKDEKPKFSVPEKPGAKKNLVEKYGKGVVGVFSPEEMKETRGKFKGEVSDKWGALSKEKLQKLMDKAKPDDTKTTGISGTIIVVIAAGVLGLIALFLED